MPIIIRLFLQWATRQLILKYGKKIGIKTLRKGLLFLGKKYFNQVLKTKIQRNGKEIPFEKWIEETPFTEIKDYFRKYEVEITPEETLSIPNQIKQEYGIHWDKYNLEKRHYEINKHAPNREINNWYTLKRNKMNLPKPEL